MQYHLGLAYDKSNQKVKAKAALQKALALHPSAEVSERIHKALAELG